jgi:hypothetical protein
LRRKTFDSVQVIAKIIKGKQLAKISLNRYLDVRVVFKQILSWLDNHGVLSFGLGLTGLTKNNFGQKVGVELAVNL